MRTVTHALRKGLVGVTDAHPWSNKPTANVGADAIVKTVRHRSGDGP